MMIIRKTIMNDFNEVCRIYDDARNYMRLSGNPEQWGMSHPPIETIMHDIKEYKSYVCIHADGSIAAVFYFAIEKEPTYARIDGHWLNDEPYGVVHRIARKAGEPGKGAAGFCLDWCFKQYGNLRIDTHRDNASMRRLLDRKGFIYCGVIWLANGDERMAYQKG